MGMENICSYTKKKKNNLNVAQENLIEVLSHFALAE